MDSKDVTQWFGEYLDAFAACGRGESETASLLAYYGVPQVMTTDDTVFTLTSGDEVVTTLRYQIDGLRAAGYSRTEIIDSEVIVMNGKSALYLGTFSRQRGDGSEISRISATYLVTDGPEGRRISALLVHS